MPLQRIRLIRILILLGLFFVLPNLHAQISVASTAGLNFGAFTRLNGGTIIISPAGAVSKTGDIIILTTIGSPRTLGSFTVSTTKAATKQVGLVSVSNTALSNLTGTGTLELTVSFDKTSFPLDKNNPAIVKMGGTLIVGPEDQPGTYSGSVDVIFNFE